MVRLNGRIGMAVGDDQVEIAVVVVVEELQPPTAHQAGGSTNGRIQRDIVEAAAAVVAVERIHFVVDIGDKQIDPAILVVIGGVDTHAGSGDAEGIVGHAGQESIVSKTA